MTRREVKVNLREGIGVSSVSERERKAKLKTEVFRMKINWPIGLYREIQYIANIEGKFLTDTVMELVREGIRNWREGKTKRLTKGSGQQRENKKVDP